GTLTGAYHWTVQLAGDANNTAIAETSQALEPETVTAAGPGVSTTPGGSVQLGSGNKLNDVATVSNGSNFLAGDTLTFRLYAPDGTTVVYTDVVTVTANGNYNTLTQGNNPGGYLPAGAGTLTGAYHWTVQLAGDANNTA